MADVVPSTVVELIDWFENNFECFTGQPRAFFEIGLGPEFSYDGNANAVFRGIYQTYAIKTMDGANAERNLVHAMCPDFAPFAGAGHALFWRLPEKITFAQCERQEFGKQIATREVIEDNLMALPVGAVEDVASGNWYEDGGKSHEWLLRTRLCIPAASWIVAPPMITKKPEGLHALSI